MGDECAYVHPLGVPGVKGYEVKSIRMPFQKSPVRCVNLFVVCEKVEKRGHNLKPMNEQ